jgi:integrase/recombinase XerD
MHEDEGAQAVSSYLRSLEVERNASRHTIRSYEANLKAYVRWCSSKGIDPIHPGRRALRAYLGYLNAAGYARTTINHHISAMHGLFGWLVIAGIIEDDPTTTLTGLKKQPRLPRKIPADQMARILAVHGPHEVGGTPREQDAADLRDQAVLELLYASGCRVSEVSGMLLRDLDLVQHQARVLGKGSKERIVPLHEISVASIRTYLHEARPQLASGKAGEWLFLSTRGNRFSEDAIRRMLRNTLAAAGIASDYTPHDIRHTFASDLLEGGADLRSVQELLGHASPSTTQIYTHLSPSYLKKAHATAHPRA